MTYYDAKQNLMVPFFTILSACQPEPIYENIWLPAPPPQATGNIVVQTEIGFDKRWPFNFTRRHCVSKRRPGGLMSPWNSEHVRFDGHLKGVLSVDNTPLLFTEAGVFYFKTMRFFLTFFIDMGK